MRRAIDIHTQREMVRRRQRRENAIVVLSILTIALCAGAIFWAMTS